MELRVHVQQISPFCGQMARKRGQERIGWKTMKEKIFLV